VGLRDGLDVSEQSDTSCSCWEQEPHFLIPVTVDSSTAIIMCNWNKLSEQIFCLPDCCQKLWRL